MGKEASWTEKNNEGIDSYVKEVFRSTFRELLGPAGLSALEHYLNRRLQHDMYEVLVSSPPIFYNALKNFLGKGADAILRILAMKLIEEGKMIGVSPEEFLELMKSDDEESYKRFLRVFKWG
ncbi:MAG: hypothetical protein QXF28_03415 [Nitrososphaerota archaeon]